ncbi:hypothetical protein QAD02_013079 [Eretmocerus hayati]|uniref:Uncharacterized protein n=1 Tax=Eretmocerus hayati TaxID=131215 RepID=A0ACC2P4E1_9HYME|nr:hypothetical protein QAD02_013079 [Eretmocerus hayati]
MLPKDICNIDLDFYFLICYNKLDFYGEFHLDELNITIQILPRINFKNYKEILYNVDPMSLRKQLFTMIYRPQKQKAIGFITQFEDVVRKFDHLANNETEKLKETEKSDFIYNAVMATVPSIQGLEFWTKNQTGERMTYREIKNSIMQAELNRQAMGHVGGAMVAQPRSDAVRCYG